MLDIKIVCEKEYLPIYQTKGASGADLRYITIMLFTLFICS